MMINECLREFRGIYINLAARRSTSTSWALSPVYESVVYII